VTEVVIDIHLQFQNYTFQQVHIERLSNSLKI